MFSPIDVAHDICSSDSSAVVFEKLVGYAEQLGFEYCCYGFKSPLPVGGENVKVFDNYPNGWMDHYRRMGYLEIDPTVEQAMTCPRTIRWPSLEESRLSAFWQDARDHGLKVGVAQSSWSARGAFGLLSLARGEREIDNQEFERLSLTLSWFANAAHSAMTVHVLDSLGLGAAISLTEREREVLQWTVEGLNASDISEKLSISASTVNWHIGKLLAKFGATNKVQAAARAVALNLL
ncbi:LuxR family transcriptional regulator [Burkholderia plantarii]|uniref:LuxR family transcriptional regulator n=1 Tax=Burkholderia plantarii TaxID=41899 RepID=UPI0007066F5E|nr:LuxR family transcriptional regulator [Burkholderia plantarii]ALK35194.1 N-acyl homoserine lactone transcriptional regulator [Burkholderia plantarii]WLE64149.1 LuxR family transcriptional regulator [Burkholderia plantarii]